MVKQLSVEEYQKLSKLADRSSSKTVGGAIYNSNVVIFYCMKCGGKLINYGGPLYFCHSCGSVHEGHGK